MKRVAMISVHECPLASSEGKERGGINVYTFELSKALSRLGWQVDAFTRIQDDINPRVVSVSDNFRVIHLPCGPHTPLSKKEILTHLPEFTDALSLSIDRYDIVHAHYYLSGIVSTAFPKPFVMTFHTLGFMKQLAGQHGDPDERIPIERTLTQSANAIISASESGKAYLTAMYDASPVRITVIPPGVDTRLFRPLDPKEAKRHIQADPNHRVVLAVGRIDPVKGFDVLLVALKMLKNTKACVWIVGGDVDQPKNQWSRELKRLSDLRDALHLKTTVRFVPPQPQEELPYFYNAADVLVMPSHYESFGMVALEALACGTPVIATDVTGISPIIKEFPHGHIVSANNPIMLAEKIKQVIGSAPLRPAKSANIDSFDWKVVAGRMAAVYEEIVSGKNPKRSIIC